MTGPQASSLLTSADDAALSVDGWGPTVTGGHAHRRLRQGLLGIAFLGVVGLTVMAVVAFTLYRVADGNLTKIQFHETLVAPVPNGPLNLLVVGSDSRDDLTDEQIKDLVLGEFDGARSDTIMLVSVSADRAGASVVSFPRDLRVDDNGTIRKLTEVFAQGPQRVVEIINETTGIPIHHYAEVSFTGFLSVVDALGGVDLCLEQPLNDVKTGAYFEAGCRKFNGTEALAFVRSRQGARGDYERIERQQQFMRALLARLVETRTLIDLPNLFRVMDRVASNVTTDDALGLGQMRTLASELRGLADGSVPMTSLPSYPQTIDGTSFVVPYAPGANALYARLANGEVAGPRGTADQRASYRVAVWTAGRLDEADTVINTLVWGGFKAGPSGRGDLRPAVTTVYELEGYEEAAQWVAAMLGASVEPLPAGVTVTEGAHVAVAVGTPAA